MPPADLEKRIEAAARAASRARAELALSQGEHMPASWTFDLLPDDLKDHCLNLASVTIRAAFPELFTNPPTHWLAPVDPTDLMQDAACRLSDEDCAIPFSVWNAMRDAYLVKGDE